MHGPLLNHLTFSRRIEKHVDTLHTNIYTWAYQLASIFHTLNHNSNNIKEQNHPVQRSDKFESWRVNWLVFSLEMMTSEFLLFGFLSDVSCPLHPSVRCPLLSTMLVGFLLLQSCWEPDVNVRYNCHLRGLLLTKLTLSSSFFIFVGFISSEEGIRWEPYRSIMIHNLGWAKSIPIFVLTLPRPRPGSF